MILSHYSPYLVGVTGHRDLREDEIPELKRRVELLFRFILSRPKDGTVDGLSREILKEMRWPDQNEDLIKEAFHRGIHHWPPFINTPLVVMSSLAPGADTLVAEVALDLSAKGLNIQVVAPLPFHREQYKTATTFQDDDPNVQRAKREKYEQLLGRIPPANVFCVRTEQDRESTEAEFFNDCQKDLAPDRRQQQRARYQSAGEYIADYSQLLIAIWDDEHPNPSSAGTESVVRSRLDHLSYGVRPGNNGLNLSHGGPTFHLYTRRQENQDQSAKDPDKIARLLYCRDTQPDLDKDSEDKLDQDQKRKKKIRDLAIWHFNSLSLQTRIARNVEHFNSFDLPDHDEIESEQNNALSLEHSDNSVTELLPVMRQGGSTHLANRLTNIIRLRKRASNANARYNEKQESTITWLFLLALTAAALAHTFIEWHPQHQKTDSHDTHAEAHSPKPGEGMLVSLAMADEPAQADGPTQADEAVRAESDDHGPGQDGAHGQDHDLKPYFFRLYPGFTAAALAFFAIGYFAYRKSKHFRDLTHDHRALAEGLRVQLYWNLVGVGRSVPANYMMRQRSELDWIRGVIRASSMPYLSWRDEFERLERPIQILAVKCALQKWIEKQETYFAKKSLERRHEMHSWHQLGAVLALSGVLGILAICIFCCWYPKHPTQNFPAFSVAAFAFAMGTASSVLATLRRGWLENDKLTPPTHHAPHEPQSFLERLKMIGFKLIEWTVCTSESQSREYQNPSREILRMAGNFFSYLLPALTLAALAVLAGKGIATVWESSPYPSTWALIILGTFLVAGALSVAWTEKHLDSEFAYQYNTMIPLFRSAKQRLEPLVFRLETLDKALNHPGARDELANELEATQNWKLAQHVRQDDSKIKVVFQETVREIQLVLYEVGMEALDENAEWLLLHRARPLEPVMAG